MGCAQQDARRKSLPSKQNAVLLQVFPGSVVSSCASYRQKRRKKPAARVQKGISTLGGRGGKILPPSHRVLALSYLACIVPATAQEGSRLFTVNPLFRIMTKIAKSTFTTGTGTPGQFYSLPALSENGYPRLNRLPVSIRIVLESLLRNCDGLEGNGKGCGQPSLHDSQKSRFL